MIVLLGLMIVISLIYRRWKIRHLVSLSKKLKNDLRSIPLIGHGLHFIGTSEDRMITIQNLGQQAIKHDGLTDMWLGSNLFVVIADPKIADIVLKKTLEKDEILRFTKLLIGNGSIFAPVPIWRPRRKILAPTFSPCNLHAFVAVFHEQSQVMADQLRKVAGKDAFSIWNYITTYTLDSVCETTLSVKVNAQLQDRHPVLVAFDKITKMTATRTLQPWLHNDTVYKILGLHSELMENIGVMQRFVQKIIKDTRKALKIKAEETKFNKDKDIESNRMASFLENLIESTGIDLGYTDLELMEETLVLVIAGTDTSAVGTSFLTVMLAKHQDVQDKIYKELVEVFGDSSRPVVPEDLPRLKYMDAVIKETLRLYPPVPIIVRKVEKDFTLPSGITLVKGCAPLINIWAVHRNPEYWGADAEEFIPERFLREPFKHPGQFLSFSYGPRNCLGYQYAMMSIKTAMANLLRTFRILPPPGQRPLRTTYEIMMKDADNFMIRLEKR